jgi:hypothetical protein
MFTETFLSSGPLCWLHSSGSLQTYDSIKRRNNRKVNTKRKLVGIRRIRVGKKRETHGEKGEESRRKPQSRRKEKKHRRMKVAMYWSQIIRWMYVGFLNRFRKRLKFEMSVNDS